MTTKELIDYVEGELKKGEQKDAIKARLLQNGWSGDDIEETFRLIEGKAAGAEEVIVPANKKKSAKITDFVVGLFVGFLFGPAFLPFILFKILLYFGMETTGEFSGFGAAMIGVPLSFLLFAGFTSYFLIKKRRYFVYGWIFSFLVLPFLNLFKPLFVNLIS